VDLLGFPGGGRLFSTKRVSPLENIAEFLRRQSCPKLDVLTAEKVFGWQKVHTSIKVRLSVRSKIRPGAGGQQKFRATRPIVFRHT
jgi:hypothetical protein